MRQLSNRSPGDEYSCASGTVQSEVLISHGGSWLRDRYSAVMEWGGW